MSNYKKLGKDMLLMTIGNLGSKIITFLFVPFYTYVLTTEEYGTVDLISTTITLLLPFFTLIIFEALMRFALDKQYDNAVVWKTGCKVNIIGVFVFLILSPLILLTPLKDYYFIVIAYFVAESFNRCLTYFARGINKIKIYAISGTLHTVILVILNLLFLLVFKLGIIGYLTASISSSVITSLFLFFSSKIYLYGFVSWKDDKELLKKMLAYSLPMIPNSVCWWIINASDRYMVTAILGNAVNGVYAVAYKIPSIISTLTTIFGSAWKLSAVDDFGSEKSKQFFSDVFSKLTTLLLLTASFLIVINKPLAHFLFSNDFYQAWKCVPLLLFASVMHAYSEFFGSIYTSSYKTKFLVYSTVMGSVVNIILNMVLIPKLGAVGAAIATMIGYLVIWIARLINSKKIIKLSFHYVRDVLCYILIIAQVFIGSNEFEYEYLFSSIIFFVIVLLVHKEIQGLIKMLLRRKTKQI